MKINNCKTCNNCKWAGDRQIVGYSIGAYLIYTRSNYFPPLEENLCLKAPAIKLHPVEGIERRYIRCEDRNTLEHPCLWWEAKPLKIAETIPFRPWWKIWGLP